MENKNYKIGYHFPLKIRESIRKTDIKIRDIALRNKLYEKTNIGKVVDWGSGGGMGIPQRVLVYMNKYIQRKQV